MRATTLLALVGTVGFAISGISPALAWSGGLRQLGGTAGCVVDENATTPIGTCATGRALLGARAVAVSPDRRHAYVVSADSNGIAVFRRSRWNGALKQLKDEAGCVVDDSETDTTCATGRALLGAFGLGVSPDGKNVYVAAEKSDAIVVFRRNPKTGALTQLEDDAGCVVDQDATSNPGCATARALQGPRAVVVSRTGRRVYVASGDSNAVAVFRRNHWTGELTQLENEAACISDGGSDSCATGRALESPRDLALKGKNLYVASDKSNGVAALTIDRRTGALSQSDDDSACIVDDSAMIDGCTTGRALLDTRGVAASRDGKSVYAAARSSNAVAVLGRDRKTGGVTQSDDADGCISDGGTDDCTTGRALLQASAVRVSRDGKSVYNAAGGSNAVDIFSRARRSGALEQPDGDDGCIVDDGGPEVTDCDNQGRALVDAQYVTVSPDDRNVYIASFNANAVAVFARKTRRHRH
jgi:6-phosphogluconolactonase (cycloisomerase 2 family)